MSGYPRNLSYFVRRLANYSKNTYRLQTLNTSTAGPSQIITVDLPNNALVDLSTLVWYFEGYTGSATNSCTFPRNIETLIDRVEVEINGQLISPGCANYSHLFQVVADTTMGEDCTNRRGLLQNGLNVDAPSANVGGSAAGAAINTASVGQPFTVCNWLGFLGSAQPVVLDTNLLGNVRVRITLANTNVLVSSATAVTGATYSLANMFFSVDCISIDDGTYYAMHDEFLGKGGVYEIPFNNFYSFAQSITAGGDGSVKFSLSTNSLNHLWATFAYAGTTPQVADTPSVANSTGSSSGAGTSRFFLRSSANITGYQFNINNQYVPNYRPNANLAFQLLMNSYNLSQDTLGGINKNIGNLDFWRRKYWVASCALDHAVGGDERFVSGLNTLGNVAQGFFEYTGASLTNGFGVNTGAGGATSANDSSSATALIFAQTTAILQVGQGRQISVVL
jgi:hypothetical protein